MIGVSGGLDSTHALIVAAQAMDRLGPAARRTSSRYTMPGFATSERHAAATPIELMQALGVTRARDRHPPVVPRRCCATSATRSPTASRSTTSPSRTCRPASAPRTCSAWPTTTTALVLGTGDLSELALGWATYGVGDQMSHYNVNASVPKTLIQHLIRWAIDTGAVRRRRQRGPAVDPRHRDLARAGPQPTATTRRARRRARESKIGPYELQDFNLYYITRFGFRPSKVAFLAQHAWGDRDARRLAGPDPGGAAQRVRPAPTIKQWLERVPLPLLPDQPVQALRDAQRAQGRLRRLALPARRLARAQRRARPPSGWTSCERNVPDSLVS